MANARTLDAPFDGIIARLSPKGRRQLAHELAVSLRKSQTRRIGQQQNPDGSRFAARKPQNNKKSRAKMNLKMFNKLRMLRHLKRRHTANVAIAEFSGRDASIATVHQEGETIPIGRGITGTYPVRQLLGLSKADEAMIAEIVLTHIESGFNYA